MSNEFYMRQVGSRRERPLSIEGAGSLLAEGARFSESVWQLSGAGYVPKGVYRFASHEAANRHELECIARAMARLAARRA